MESNLEDIDAIWFQKKVSEIFGNTKVDELLDILGGDYDDMEVKNRLLLCMKNEYSDFVDFLLKNRFKIGLTKVMKNLSLEASEEVCIAATPTDSSSEEDYNIVKISAMPDWAQPAFKGMTQLNRVQSKVYETALLKPDNLLLCAPTGAGKDIVAVLTILHQIALHRNPYNGYIDHTAYKILYMTHSEAVVVKLVRMLSQTFEDYGIKVGELNEDPSLTWEQIEESQIMVTTPDKWDIITRKIQHHRTYTEQLTLIIVDDCHFLNENKGYVLESIMTRTILHMKNSIRVVGFSATFPNYVDVARFLHADVKNGIFTFDDSYRHVPITQRCIGIKGNIEIEMNHVCCEKVMSVAGKNPVILNESQYISKLADQLNAEIVLGTVQNVKEARLWIRHTYTYVCMLTNPSSYGLAPDVIAKDIENNIDDLIHEAATLLDESNLVKYDTNSGCFQVMDFGRIASYHNVAHRTISMYNNSLKPTMGYKELCQLFSLSEELKHVTVKEDEKMQLEELFNHVHITIKESLEEPTAKINVLLQAYISQTKLEGLSMTSDMVFITQSAGRLLRALFEIVLTKGFAQLAEKALNLCKMVTKRMWSVQTPLCQFNVIPSHILTKLKKKDLTWEKYFNLSAQEVGELIRAPNMGRRLHKLIRQFPKLNLVAHVRPTTSAVLGIDLTITPDFAWDDKVHGYVEPFWVIVEDKDGARILHREVFLLKKQHIEEDHTLNFTVSVDECLPPQYSIRVVSDKWLGSQTVLPVSCIHLILPENYPPTELLDLQPLPVTALKNTSYEALYQDFKHFNPVQTQVFTVLYNSDDNVLVAAPTGSGKTICAEFAILRRHQINTNNDMLVVYLTPNETLAKQQYLDWDQKFGNGLKLKVVELTGDIKIDLKLLKEGQIIVGTPEKWDALTHFWEAKYLVKSVSLFIIDQLHLIGEQGGHVIEGTVSRMISRDIGINGLIKSYSKVRLVGLSTSVSNAKDLGEWIGATSHGFFNFPLGKSVEIQTQGVDVANFEARMKAMTKPTYIAITQLVKNEETSIVFVPSRKYVRLVAVDLIKYKGADSDKKSFLLNPLAELVPFINKISDDMLKTTLREGVGFLHEGLSGSDRDIVTRLFKSGLIQVCIITSSICREVKLSTPLVIVMGTQYYDGPENSQTNYPVADLLQMVQPVSSPLVNGHGKFIILCHTPREEYYKALLSGTYPVESVLPHFLHDYILVGVAGKFIYFKKDVVESYLANTFLYKRLTKNPKFYGCQDLAVHMSDLGNNTVADLQANKCVVLGDDRIYCTEQGEKTIEFCISYKTMAMFSASLTSTTDLGGLLDIVSKAPEFDALPIRFGIDEEEEVRRLLSNQIFSYENSKFKDTHAIANALLQAHLSRTSVGVNLAICQKYVLSFAHKLLQAIIAIASKKRWLGPTVLAITFNQMLIQGTWETDSVLLQVPHVTKQLAIKCQKRNISSLDDLKKMEHGEKYEIFNMPDSRLSEISQFFSHYFIPVLVYQVEHAPKSSKEIEVKIWFEIKKDEKFVHAPLFPTTQRKTWWLIVQRSDDCSFDMGSIEAGSENGYLLKFTVPNRPGRTTLVIRFMCNSYRGFDRFYYLNVDVVEDGKVMIREAIKSKEDKND